MIELVAPEIEAAHQRVDRAVLRVERDERRLDLRQLQDPPGLALALHANDRAAPDPPLRRGGCCGERPPPQAPSLPPPAHILPPRERRPYPSRPRPQATPHHRRAVRSDPAPS